MNRKKSFNSPALWEHLLFLCPASIVFVIVIIIPFIISVGYSFTDWNGVSSNISFIGIKNFIDIFTGKSNFLGAFKFTFIIAICNVVCMNIAGIAIAALLTTKIPLQSAFRVVFYLPNIIGGLILGFVWQFIFINGVPAIGKLLHFGPLMTPWLGTEMTAYAAIVIVSVWQGMGYVMVIMIAALTGISSELVEAAKIDGANAAQIFRKITLPYIMFIMGPYIITQFTGNINNFNVIYLLSAGKPTPVGETAGKTDLLVTWLYKLTVDYQYYNIGAVIGILTFVVLSIVALVTYRNTKAYKDEEGFM